MRIGLISPSETERNRPLSLLGPTQTSKNVLQNENKVISDGILDLTEPPLRMYWTCTMTSCLSIMITLQPLRHCMNSSPSRQEISSNIRPQGLRFLLISF